MSMISTESFTSNFEDFDPRVQKRYNTNNLYAQPAMINPTNPLFTQ